MKTILVLSFFVTFPLLGAGLPAPPTSPVDQSGQPPADDVEHLHGGLLLASTPKAPSQVKSPRVLKWTGSLVDSGCMADALRQVPSMDQILSPEPLSQYYFQALHDSQRTGQENAPGPYTKIPSHSPGPSAAPGSNADPETSDHELEMQKAQLKRAELMDQKVRMCTPNHPPSHFGLFVPDGRLLKFDAGGDLKAMKAFTAAVLRPGRALKAKVRGVFNEEENTVRVASIEIKGESELSRELIETSSLQ
jgi:hypothetical protein